MDWNKFQKAHSGASPFTQWLTGFVSAMNLQQMNQTGLVDGATITPDYSTGCVFTFTAANNNARVFQIPTNAPTAAVIAAGPPAIGVLWEARIRIANTSGGNLTATTFAAGIKQPAAVTMPATGFNRWYNLMNDGTNTILYSFSGADIAN